jgi:hypothetical protein
MKKAFIMLMILSFAFPLCAQDFDDIQGWNGVRWGMTNAEILETFKGEAIQLPRPDNYKSHYADIGLNNYKISNNTYNVRFLMSRTTNTLLQVNIAPTGNISKTNYDILEKLLFDKYGKWAYKNEDKEPDKRVSRTIVLDGTVKILTAWNFKNTDIELSYNEIASDIRFLTLSYKKRDNADNSKL